MEKVTQVWIFSVQGLSFVALTLRDQALGYDAELFAVGQRLAVWVGGGRHEQRINLLKVLFKV